MANFLFVYRNDVAQECQEPSPEEIQAFMQQWTDWYEKVGDGIVNGGDGLMPTGKVLRGTTVTDGPFIEAKELVGGFSIVRAADYEQALEFARSCPINAMGGSIEVRELAGFASIES